MFQNKCLSKISISSSLFFFCASKENYYFIWKYRKLFYDNRTILCSVFLQWWTYIPRTLFLFQLCSSQSQQFNPQILSIIESITVMGLDTSIILFCTCQYKSTFFAVNVLCSVYYILWLTITAFMNFHIVSASLSYLEVVHIYKRYFCIDLKVFLVNSLWIKRYWFGNNF